MDLRKIFCVLIEVPLIEGLRPREIQTGVSSAVAKIVIDECEYFIYLWRNHDYLPRQYVSMMVLKGGSLLQGSVILSLDYLPVEGFVWSNDPYEVRRSLDDLAEEEGGTYSGNPNDLEIVRLLSKQHSYLHQQIAMCKAGDYYYFLPRTVKSMALSFYLSAKQIFVRQRRSLARL